MSTIKGIYKKYKLAVIVIPIIIIGFILFKSYHSPINEFTLPHCDEPEIVNERLPNRIYQKLKEDGVNVTYDTIQFNDIKQISVDWDQGIRQCQANLSIRINDGLHSKVMRYQIVSTDGNKRHYTFNILF